MFRRDQVNFVFLNFGHLYDHFFMLIFATAAALALIREWGLTYAELIPYATPGFVAFGVCSLPMGYLADKWSRPAMIALFFIGAGATSIAAGFADTPLQIGAALLALGIFAAIYHPVGIAMVVQGRSKAGVAVAINGVFGNIGVAAAALVTGFIIDAVDWRSAFILPGIISVITGVLYILFLGIRTGDSSGDDSLYVPSVGGKAVEYPELPQRSRISIFTAIFATTACGGLIFQSTTFALPKVFDERLGELAVNATQVGAWAFFVFMIAALAQLLIGYLLDNRSARTVFVAVAAIQALFFALMVNLTGVPALIVSLGFMFAVFGQIPINDVLIGRVVSTAWRSRAYAIRSFITFTVMASSLPLIAWIHANWSFSNLFILMAVIAGVITVAAWSLPRIPQITGLRPVSGTAAAE